MSGHAEAVQEFARLQSGRRTSQSSDAEERLRKLKAGERVEPKPEQPLIPELLRRGPKSRVVSVTPPSVAALPGLLEFFGEDHKTEPEGGVPPGSPVKPRNETIARMVKQLRRERNGT